MVGRSQVRSIVREAIDRMGRMICRPGKDELPEDIPEDLVQAILEARRAEH